MPRKKNADSKKTTTSKRRKGKGAKYVKPSTLTFRIDGDLRDRLQKIAKDEYTSESSLCNRYIAQGIEQDALARTKKIDRRLAALELTILDKDGFQTAQGVVDTLGQVSDQAKLMEQTLASVVGLTEKLQARLDEIEEDLFEDEDVAEEPEEDAEETAAVLPPKGAVAVANKATPAAKVVDADDVDVDVEDEDDVDASADDDEEVAA